MSPASLEGTNRSPYSFRVSGESVALSLVVGRDESTRDGVDVDATPKYGMVVRGRFLLWPSSSKSCCEARSRLPNGEFLRPDIAEACISCRLSLCADMERDSSAASKHLLRQ